MFALAVDHQVLWKSFVSKEYTGSASIHADSANSSLTNYTRTKYCRLQPSFSTTDDIIVRHSDIYKEFFTLRVHTAYVLKTIRCLPKIQFSGLQSGGETGEINKTYRMSLWNTKPTICETGFFQGCAKFHRKLLTTDGKK
ncbi:unnamed protein product [Acanthoscelides obtectus]|uniref:Uncharacterized protein n=1 Tax=Acanthoscelides obtectus TaxID=200917 RepID=A0A9P0KTJ4_ACAOB|nr:unnamed protein product [Acanthoscelides obtectus]CAK1661948.1 hypothetical protein AOBTE_LOCUS22892 [Acanthoscelides obtectus]